MIEILFRGKSKSINKGEWIYGSFVEDTDLNACCIRDKSLVYELVDRETVGQYTGLTDKNGKKIFEGDILKIISSVQGEIIGYTRAFKSEKREDCAVVLWDYKTGGYKLKVYHKGKYKRIAKFAIGHLFVYKAEVIGNIYDNPELLEVEQ